MSGLPWIKVWTAIGDHPKIQRLERELGLRDALGVVVRLWCWTADYCPSGDIPGTDIDTAAKAARGDSCRKPVQAMVNALVTAGLLDPTDQGFRVHDWHDMQTVHVEAEEKRREQARDRQAAYRARHGLSPSRNASRNALPERDSVTETEKETEKETETDSQPADGGLADLASALATQFGFTQPLGLGKDPARTRREFARWLSVVGPQETAMECLRLANERAERPRHLSWFVGWLETVSDSRLAPKNGKPKRAPGDWWDPAPGPPPDDSVPLFPDRS